MDWFSRYALSWEISNSLDTYFYLSALDKAFVVGKPEIFSSDQGSQFTSEAFTGRPTIKPIGDGYLINRLAIFIISFLSDSPITV